MTINMLSIEKTIIINKIMIPKTFKVYLYDFQKIPNTVGVGTFLKNIEDLGFTFSKEAISLLLTYNNENLSLLYNIILPILKDMIGNNVIHTPMYPNFPSQVMKLSTANLYINAILHYFGDKIGARIIPKYEEKDRDKLINNYKLITLGVFTIAELHSTMVNIMSANTSISPTDVNYINIYLNNMKELSNLPDKFNYKEILTTVTGIILKNKINGLYYRLSPYYKSMTDVLRLATVLSNGDVSLANNTKFIKFNRATRRLLLNLMEGTHDKYENMYKYKNKWVRLGEIIHPGEYKEKYPYTFKAFNDIRNNVKNERYNTKLEKYLTNNTLFKAITLLEKKPTMFARKLDHLFRLSNKTNETHILLRFLDIVNMVSTPVLLQLISHFKNRDINQTPYRIFFPKGTISKAQTIKNKHPPLDNYIITSIIKICENELNNRFKIKEYMGKVFIDENLKDYLIPFSERSANNSLKSLVRGSKISLPEGNFLRFFLWWKDGDSRVDVDLSAILLDSNWNYVRHISYTNLKSKEYNAAHSGDITSAPNGASEFIDIDINSFVNNNMQNRYVVMSVLSYTKQPFTDFDCFAGWMMRKNQLTGEIYEPKTVQNKFNFNANSRTVIPMIFDLVDKKMIWMDISMKGKFNNNNIENNFQNINTLCKSFVEIKKPNIYDLLKLHATARSSEIVDNKEDADIIFDAETTPYEFNHEWLCNGQ